MESSVETIRLAQKCQITQDQALRTLASNNVHGAFNRYGAYTGYDYTNQSWIALNADGSEDHDSDTRWRTAPA